MKKYKFRINISNFSPEKQRKLICRALRINTGVKKKKSRCLFPKIYPIEDQQNTVNLSIGFVLMSTLIAI